MTKKEDKTRESKTAEKKAKREDRARVKSEITSETEGMDWNLKKTMEHHVREPMGSFSLLIVEDLQKYGMLDRVTAEHHFFETTLGTCYQSNETNLSPGQRLPENDITPRTSFMDHQSREPMISKTPMLEVLTRVMDKASREHEERDRIAHVTQWVADAMGGNVWSNKKPPKNGQHKKENG